MVTGFESFCYDKAGNRTRYNISSTATCTTGTAATYTYNTANQITAATGVTPTGATLAGSSFTYDANGNETGVKSGIGRTTTYGDRDQATSFTPAGGSAITQKYSGNGKADRVLLGSPTFLVSPVSPAPAQSITSGTTTWSVRDPDGNLIAIRVAPQ